jgi:hypothetical protein
MAHSIILSCILLFIVLIGLAIYDFKKDKKKNSDGIPVGSHINVSEHADVDIYDWDKIALLTAEAGSKVYIGKDGKMNVSGRVKLQTRNEDGSKGIMVNTR